MSRPIRPAARLEAEPAKTTEAITERVELDLGVPRPLARLWNRLARFGLLAFSDCLSVSASACVAVAIWAVPVRHQPPELYLRLWPLLGLILIAFAAEGLYPGFGLGAVEAIRRLSIGTISVFVAVAAGSFILQAPQVYSRVTFLITAVLSLISVPAARFAVLSWAHRRSDWGEPSVIIGTGPLAREAVQLLAEARTLGYSPRWVVSETGREDASFESLPVLSPGGSLDRLAKSGVRTVLLATEEADWWSRVDELRRIFRNVIVIQSGKNIPLEGLKVRNLGGVLGIEFRNQLLHRRNRLVKRAMDIVGSTLALLVFSPLILLAALLIRILSPGPVLFRQTREGMKGCAVRVLKLRTMCVDAEEKLAKHLDGDAGARDQWEQSFKLKDDPRVIPLVGKTLRRFSIDELPQFWNVLKGDMSLVGPRPLPRYHLEKFDEAFRELRGIVRPGMTGLWQVLQRHQGSLENKKEHDSYYIRNWSIWIDLYILGRTVFAVVAGRGS
ncbi:MAG: exopolysaccharide biosynthesis polyprenyl glycosylphosphotransferase [Thermoanaerobaculia bacterium]